MHGAQTQPSVRISCLLEKPSPDASSTPETKSRESSGEKQHLKTVQQEPSELQLSEAISLDFDFLFSDSGSSCMHTEKPGKPIPNLTLAEQPFGGPKFSPVRRRHDLGSQDRISEFPSAWQNAGCTARHDIMQEGTLSALDWIFSDHF